MLRLESPRELSQERIGVIGGSGLYRMDGVEVEEEIALDTPFGPPSDSFLLCRLGGREVLFLPRHGRGHGLLPGEVPFRANIYGMKKLGVGRILAVGAVGSMREHIHPCDVVVPDQFIDRTRGRKDTFFGDGVVAHIALADPVCGELAALIADAAASCGATLHRGGTYLCMEGPAFSTRAESLLYRNWGVNVIGMTNLHEAKLAREAEICYATTALVTDYDCWHESEESVSVEMLLGNLRHNAELAQGIIRAAVAAMGGERTCPCATALKYAVITPPEHIPPEIKKKLDVIIGKYVE